MRKTLTFHGVALLISGFLGIILGIFMITTIPDSWIYGLFILLIGLAFIIVGLRSKISVQEESEKPLLDATQLVN